MYNKSPFADWVPKPLMLIFILVILFPVMSVSGVYTTAATDIAGGLAMYNEFISLANNATTIGMGLSMLIILRVKMRFRSKEIIATSAIVLALLSVMNGTTDNPYVLVAGSFLIGFFKMFPMIEMILPVMFILSPTGDRGKFYAIFYPLSIVSGQYASYLFSDIVFESGYQAPYFIMAIIMLIIAVISLMFQHNQRFCFKMPLYYIDWLSMLILFVSAMSLNVGLTFMKQQAWFDSLLVVGSLLIAVITFILLVIRQRYVKRPFFDFKQFYKKANVAHSMILLLFLGVFLASSSIFSQYAVGVLEYNNQINASFNLWMIPGIIVAGIMAFVGFKNEWYIKYYIAAGFVAFFFHNLSLYFLIQPQMDIAYLNYSMIIKGLGMGILFIGIWFYASVDVPMDKLFGIMCILLMTRTFISTAIGGAIIGWVSYQSQWQSLNDIAIYLDINSIQNGMAMFKTINLNALMASSKIVLGTLSWLIIPILIFVMTHHYGVFNYRRAVFFRKAIRGNSIKGYKF